MFNISLHITNKLTRLFLFLKHFILTTENAYCVINDIVIIIAETVSYNYFKK